MQQSKLKQSKKQKLRLKRKLRLNAKPLLKRNKNVLQQNKPKQSKKQKLKRNRRPRLKLRPKQRLEQKLKRSKPKSLNYLNPILMSATRHLQKALLQQVKRIYFHSQLTHHYKLIHLPKSISHLMLIITNQCLAR